MGLELRAPWYMYYMYSQQGHQTFGLLSRSRRTRHGGGGQLHVFCHEAGGQRRRPQHRRHHGIICNRSKGTKLSVFFRARGEQGTEEADSYFVTKPEDERRDNNEESYKVFGFQDAAMLHKVAAAYRVKYRIDSQGNTGAQASRERRHPLRVGVHPLNRDGSGLNSDRVDQVLFTFVKHGFLSDEADHDAVLVLETVGKSDITVYMYMYMYNKELCLRDPQLAWPPAEMPLEGGTIGHSHVNQVLRHILLQADTSISALAGPDKRIEHSLVNEKDPEL